MERLPILRDGERVGEAVAEQERLYTCLRICAPTRPGLWYAWAVGERGEIRVGVLEPDGGVSGISRRFSRQTLDPAGTLTRIELRLIDSARERQATSGAAVERQLVSGAAERQTVDGASERRFIDSASAQISSRTPEARWSPPVQGQRLFRTPRFQRQTRGVRYALTRTEHGRRRVALLREDDAPFPIPELFCLASAARIGARDYWVFSFDRQEWPVL